MSTPNKRSATETWAAIRAIADEHEEDWDDEAADREAERIMALSPEEVQRELVEAGFNLDEVRARTDRFLAEILGPSESAGTPAEAAATPQSPAELPPPAQAATPALAVAASAATPSAATPSAETPSAETPSAETPSAETPFEAAAVPAVPSAAPAPIRLDPGPKSAPVRAPRRTPVAPWLLAAAFALVVISSWRFAGETIARWVHPAPEPTIVPDTPNPSMVAEARAKEHAKDLRMAAHAKCASGDWQECTLDLDEAAKLDPAGDADSAVQADRAAARDALSSPIGPKTKPKM